ncbi:MAG TPA: DNA-directed RNA polymerase subunit A' [Candidatus Nanopusillus sp.]|nr:DNA-directed RNA polymerase subunit A' [Candidatus Nanopusillus sp.]
MEVVYKKISGIKYALLNPEAIRKLSVVKIITPELYDEEGYPIRGGLMDPRMGVVDPGLRCETCGKPAGKCPGHFGHIELARPVLHIEFLPIIYDTLQIVCHQCGRLKLTENELDFAVRKIDRYKKSGRWTRAYKFIKKFVITRAKNRTKCPHCNYENPKVELRKPYRFYVIDKDGEERRMFPVEIRSIFEKIPEKDALALGFDNVNSRPEWMILTVLPVPPVPVRPSIILETGERAEDDLTHKLVDIVRTNQRLHEAIATGAPQIVVEDLYDLLQYHVATYINNTLAGIPKAVHRSGKPIKSLVERISGKEGRIRYNLLGKRVNFSARAVISPDTKIRINEVGIPVEVAKTLTIPERVTEWNIEKLKQYVLNGPDRYPGANYIISPDGKRFTITEDNKELLAERLQPGWIVERHLLNGDIVLFGRYPSLHRLSIMGHYVRILPGKTFRLHPAACTPYNADFDGDEMNIHVPQTEEARAETKYLVALENHMISPRYGLTIVGGIQDVITGLYLLTQDDTRIEFSKAVELVYLANPSESEIEKLVRFIKRAKEEGRDYLTGKEIFSVFLPDDLIFEESGVKIEDGELKEGSIDALMIKSEKGVLIRYIYDKYGPRFALEWSYKVFLLGVHYQYLHGITVTPSDWDLPEEAMKKIREILEEADKKVQEIMDQYKHHKLPKVPGRSEKQVFENMVQQVLSEALTEIGEIVKKYAPISGTTLMAITKARGDIRDLAQIISALGQQSFRGGLIEFGYKKRNLSMFKPGDIHPITKGWVKSGYREGLKPYELFFHALPGRDALMDTAIRTAKSGYLYRRVAHALYEIYVHSDGTVRDTTGRVIQLLFGEDGMFPQKTHHGKLDIDGIIKEILKKVEKEK